MGYFIHSYGEFVKVHGKQMCVSVEGSGKDVVILLPGAGSPSPVLEMKALVSFLKEKYTVITLEYLGYGLSDPPDSERVIDNITNELHEAIYRVDNIVDEIHAAICRSGYAEYYLAAHSISGVYSLYYADKYPNEIKGFIGIDSSVPKQTDNRQLVAKTISSAKRNYKHSKSRLWWWVTNLTARKRLKQVKSYSYSKDEICDYGLLAALQMSSKDMLNEYLYIDDNFSKVRNMKFPSHIPILFILAKESKKLYPDWYELHKELLENNDCKIITVKGGHYLHLTQPEKVAKEIDGFICSLKQ